jgi:hypothetical protein
MKKTSLFLIVFLVGLSFVHSSTPLKLKFGSVESNSESVSFRVKGTGFKNIDVSVGIGTTAGTGRCCTTISASNMVSFNANVGEVLYDGKTKRIITKIYPELNGTTINLSEYY